MSYTSSLTDAFKYCDENGIEVPPSMYIRARRVGALKAEGDLSKVNAKYHDAITKGLIGYFEGGSIVSARNSLKRAAVESFGDAFDIGWLAGGGELPADADALSWFNARVELEFGYIGQLMEQAKALKKEEGFEFFEWVNARADSYTNTISAIYNAASMWANKNQMLTWHLGNTETHCDTCKQLNGKSHRASWYLSRNYIPRQPGAAMDCGGYHCDCSLKDKSGNIVTI